MCVCVSDDNEVAFVCTHCVHTSLHMFVCVGVWGVAMWRRAWMGQGVWVWFCMTFRVFMLKLVQTSSA